MARVSDVWKDGQWNFTPSRSGDLVAILAGLFQVRLRQEGSVRCLLSHSEQFTCNSTWNAIRDKQQEVDWYKLEWFLLQFQTLLNILCLTINEDSPLMRD